MVFKKKKVKEEETVEEEYDEYEPEVEEEDEDEPEELVAPKVPKKRVKVPKERYGLLVQRERVGIADNETDGFVDVDSTTMISVLGLLVDVLNKVDKIEKAVT